MEKEKFLRKLFAVAKIIARYSNGKIELVKNQQNEGKKEDKEAGNFLKLNGERFGADLELYDYLGEIVNYEYALALFYSEIVVFSKTALPEGAYKKVSKEIHEFGKTFISNKKTLEGWNKIFQKK
jgi:hypothetical protein